MTVSELTQRGHLTRGLTEKEFRENVSYLRKQMQRRINNLKNYEKYSGIKSRALEAMRDKGYLQSNNKLVGIKNMDRQEAWTYMKELQRFSQSKTSTVSGYETAMWDVPRQQMAEKMGISGEGWRNISLEEVRDFWNTFDKIKEDLARGNRSLSVYNLGSDRVLELYAEEFENGGFDSVEDLIESVKDRYNKMSEREQEEMEADESLIDDDLFVSEWQPVFKEWKPEYGRMPFDEIER